MNITILQSDLLTERGVPASLITYLYNLGEDSGIALSGAIEITEGVFKNEIDAIREWYPYLYITANKEYFYFADLIVQRILTSNYSSDGIGLTLNAVLNITLLKINLFLNSKITEFNELKYFSRLSLIKSKAFANCSKLTSISIPSSLTSIESLAFNLCTNLLYVHISDIEAWCKIDFSSVTSNPLYYSGCLYIDGVELTDLIIPEEVTTISENAFYNCQSILSITFPSSVTSIGTCAFYGCTSLTEVTLPTTIIEVGSKAFGNCPISKLTCLATTPPSVPTTYAEFVPSNCEVYVPAAAVATYLAASGWSNYTIQAISST